VHSPDFPVPASIAARCFTSIFLLAVTVMVLQLVLHFNQQALVAGAGRDLAQIKTHGFAVVLGVMAMLNIAWFSALIRMAAAEAQIKARAVAKAGRRVAE